MWAWLYATRIPAIRKNKIILDPQGTKEEFNEQIPAKTRWKADNYNHLMEQPTLFYAVTLTLALVDAGSGLNTKLAWLYVGLRIAHSLVRTARAQEELTKPKTRVSAWHGDAAALLNRFLLTTFSRSAASAP